MPASATDIEGPRVSSLPALGPAYCPKPRGQCPSAMPARFDGGRVAERGTYAKLMALDGRYASMFRTHAAACFD